MLFPDQSFARTPDHAPDMAVESIAGDLARGLILLCDHASNAIPDEYQKLGLPDEQLERHIGYDIGAAYVVRRMAEVFGAPALLTQFSRLVIDPNRGIDDPTLVMRLSDGAIVPGNRWVDNAEIERRIRRFHAPYDHAITSAINASLAAGVVPVIISMHSFTPFWRGVPRPWHLGVLRAGDGRLSVPLINTLRNADDLVIGDNEPYHGALPGDVIDRHAIRRGLSNTLIEIRQDLIASERDAQAWADRLVPVLSTLLEDPVHRRQTAWPCHHPQSEAFTDQVVLDHRR